MADDSQGFFKSCLMILPKNCSSELHCWVDSSDEEDFEIPSKQRKLYSETGTIGCKSKLMSVKRTILLCIVPNIKESYENEMKKMKNL